MAQSVRADLERLSRLASEVTRFVEALDPRSVLMWIDALPAALRDEPSFRTLVADVEGLRRHRSKLEQMVSRLQRQVFHLQEYLAAVEYRYQYAYRSYAVSAPVVYERAVCPQRYVVAPGEYAVPNAYAPTGRVCRVPDAGALERILAGWSMGVGGQVYGGSPGLDDRLSTPVGSGSTTGQRDYADPNDDPSRYST